MLGSGYIHLSVTGLISHHTGGGVNDPLLSLDCLFYAVKIGNVAEQAFDRKPLQRGGFGRRTSEDADDVALVHHLPTEV